MVEMTKFQAWLSERAITDYISFSTLSDLHSDFRAWAVRHKVIAEGKKALTAALVKEGFLPHRTAGARGFKGLRLVN